MFVSFSAIPLQDSPLSATLLSNTTAVQLPFRRYHDRFSVRSVPRVAVRVCD